MRFSAFSTFAFFLSYFILSVLALNKNSNHKFLPKVVTRIEEKVHNFESYFHIKKSKNGVTGSNSSEPKQWAVLVAGSNGYYNYRHQVFTKLHSFSVSCMSCSIQIFLQADVCHAYQVLRKHGIPAENIITLMYDDIANSTE